MKKLLHLLVFLLLSLPLALLSWEVSEENIPDFFEQHPPIPTEYWVRQLEGNHPDGNLILEIKYQSDFKLPERLKIYLGKNRTAQLKDDGQFPDQVAEDMSYTTLLKQAPNLFRDQYLAKQNRVIEKGYLFNFTGHVGEMVTGDEIIKFDTEAFENHQKVQIDPMVVNETYCDDYTTIKKQQSLFITDLRVVENDARTYNIIEETGNPVGAWTFGALMKDMAGGFSVPATQQEQQKVKEFLKIWVLGLEENYSINNRNSGVRAHGLVLKFVIKPWLLKAYQQEEYNSFITDANWEAMWDDVDVHDLLINAPFKLTAIVNRMDLRGSSAYTSELSNSGETRFVYSLISPYDYPGANNNDNVGAPPFHDNISIPLSEMIDWQGMNVILEYGNIESDKCDIKQRAQDWIHLSTYDMDDFDQLQDYLFALEQLTNTVIDKNANPEKPNGSAINQVRSNEKLFATIIPSGSDGWKNADWQLRQFEVNQEGLSNAPVTNVPFDDNNLAANNSELDQATNSTEIIDWIYGVDQAPNYNRVRHGNHSLPDNLTQPAATLKDEMLHYYGIDFWHEDMPTAFYDKYNDEGSASLREKKVRRQLSLNTCMGCHGGETKTLFTMIRPLGYGQEANYWDPIPSSTTGPIDHRFFENDGFTTNLGTTFDEYLQGDVPNFEPNYYVGENRTIPNVSPFLTGRNYRGAEGLWQDDNFADANDADNLIEVNGNLLGDDKITGMFYVNDPSNASWGTQFTNTYVNHVYSENSEYLPFPRLHDSEEGRVGFNDLLRRQRDLCNLANSCCDDCPELQSLLLIVRKTFFIPLPEKGH